MTDTEGMGSFKADDLNQIEELLYQKEILVDALKEALALQGKACFDLQPKGFECKHNGCMFVKKGRSALAAAGIK